MRSLVLPAVMLLAILTSPVPAAAHEKGVLRPATRELAAGDTLAVSGEHFTESAALELLLVGPRGRLPLGTVRTDSMGTFTARLMVPLEAGAGAYRLVAVAADGDEVAAVDVAVLPARAAGPAPAAVPIVEEPSAEPLALDRARSPLVTGAVLAAAVAAALLGVSLLRRRPPAPGAGSPGYGIS